MRLIDADALKESMRGEFIDSVEERIAIREIDEAPTIEPKHGENLNNKYADCDQFICSECGIELRDWTRVEVDEDDGEEYHYEYVFRFCPNCGADIRGAGDDSDNI